MELRDLRAYLAVCDAQSFTRAGTQLHMVQSSVSDAVRRLERELGVRLLERRRSGVRPTPEGRALARWARLATTASDRALAEVAELQTRALGRVGLGLLPTITPMVLRPLLASLREHHPGLKLDVHAGLAPELIERVQSAEIDLAVLFFPARTVPELEFVEVSARAPSLLVNRAHPLVARGAASLADAAAEGWITYPPHNPGRMWLEQACAAAGFVPLVAAEVETATQQQIFVEEGLGVAMVPLGQAHATAGDTRLIELAPPLPEFRIGYVCDPRTESNAVACVRTTLEEILAAD